MAKRRSSSKAVVWQNGRRMSREKSNELEKRYPQVGITPGPERIKTMARELGLEYSQVNGWFVNKRAKVRTELAKKELETENNLLRAKNQQLEAIIRDLVASNEHLKSQLMVMESRQRDVKNTEILESSRPVGFTGVGTSSGIVTAAAPEATVAAPAYPRRHILQGTVNEPAVANMLNNNYGYGPVAAPAYPHLQETGNEPAVANMLSDNYGYGPVAAPAYPHLQGTGNEPAVANMLSNNYGYGPVAAPAYPHLQGTVNEPAVANMLNNNYGYGPVAAPAYPHLQRTGNEPTAANMLNNNGYGTVAAAPAYPRRHLLQGTVNEPAAANMLNNNGYGTVAAAPEFDIDAYDEVAMINNSYECGGYCDVEEYRPFG